MDTPTVPPPRCARIIALSERRPRRAIGLARRLLAAMPPDHSDLPWAQLTLGWCLVGWDDLPAPVQLLQEAETSLAARGAAWGVLTARTALLLAALLQRGGAELLGAWEDLAAAWDAAGWAVEGGRARMSQVRTLNTLGRPYEALSLAASIAPLMIQAGTLADQGTLACYTGAALLQTGDFASARAQLARAEAIFEQLGQPANLAKVWFEQGGVAFLTDDFSSALALYMRAHDVFARLGMPLRAAICDKNIGLSFVKLGQTDQAIAKLLAARATMVAIGQPYQVADCAINLGNAAYHSGLYELALGTWRQTEATYVQLSADRMALVSRRNQAEALIRLGQIDAAEALLTALVTQATQIGAHRDLPEILQGLGEVFHARGELTRALDHLQQAEALFTALSNPRAAARARMAQGWLHLASDSLTAAEGCFRQAEQDLAGSPPYHWRAIYGLGRCAERAGKLDKALAFYHDASARVARLRHKLSEEHASSALFREAAQLMSDAISLAAALNDPLKVLGLSEQQRALALQQQIRREPIILPPALRAAHEARRAHLRALVAEGVSGSDLDQAVTDYIESLLHGRHYGPALTEAPERPFCVDALRADLAAHYGDNWTALIYISCGEDLLTLSLDMARLDLSRIPLTQQLRRRLDRACLPQYRAYTYQDAPFQSGQRATPWEDLAALGAELIPPRVRTRLHPAHRLVIVPGGPLHSLPWAALRVHHRWLIEQAIIQIAPSLQLWGTLAQQARPGDDALLIGVSHFHGRAASLPGALPSLDLVARYWPGAVSRLEDEQATRARVRAAIAGGKRQRWGLVHISTHGHLVSGRGLLAHLKLTDDDLLVDEVAELRLDGALVVLAACDGAIGETLPGEDLLSLNRALLAAGAHDVIASLWQLYDLMVIPLLEPLYAALAAGMSAPEALAEAQRACIATGPGDPASLRASPLIWASLCTLGAGGWLLAPAGGITPADPMAASGAWGDRTFSGECSGRVKKG